MVGRKIFWPKNFRPKFFSDEKSWRGASPLHMLIDRYNIGTPWGPVCESLVYLPPISSLHGGPKTESRTPGRSDAYLPLFPIFAFVAAGAPRP